MTAQRKEAWLLEGGRAACCGFVLLLRVLFAGHPGFWISGRLILVLPRKGSFDPIQLEVAERTPPPSPLTFFPSYPVLGVGREVERLGTLNEVFAKISRSALHLPQDHGELTDHRPHRPFPERHSSSTSQQAQCACQGGHKPNPTPQCLRTCAGVAY